VQQIICNATGGHYSVGYNQSNGDTVNILATETRADVIATALQSLLGLSIVGVTLNNGTACSTSGNGGIVEVCVLHTVLICKLWQQ
jgi:hypothetical protein